MDIGDIVRGEIVDLTDQGQGVLKIDGVVVFTDGGLPGDLVEVEIIRKRKKLFFARTLVIIEKSLHRREALCPHRLKCSGCSLQDLDYGFQIKLKENNLENKIKRIGGEEFNIKVLPSKREYGYRNRISLKVDERGRLGYFQRGTNKHLPIKTCPIASSIIENALCQLQRALKYLAKDIHESFPIKEVEIKSPNNKSLMLVFKGENVKFYGSKSFFNKLEKSLKASVFFETTSKNPSLSHISGPKFLDYEIGKYKFSLSPRSFTQVNRFMTEDLYNIGKSYLQEVKPKKLLDLFCGIGTTSLYFSETAKHVLGVELIEESVQDANRSAQINGVDNVIFQQMDLNQPVQELFLKEKPDTLVVDPPRAGLSKSLIEAVITSTVKNIVYISCDPGTLSRDLKLFTDSGFHLKKIQGVDMFPQTLHIECVIGMQRKDT